MSASSASRSGAVGPAGASRSEGAAGRKSTIPRDRPRLTGRAAALLVAVALLAMVAVVPLRQYLDQRGRIAELERHTAELERTNDELRREISRLHDPAELERRARACLGMVGPGETALIVPGPGRAPDGC